MADRVWRRDAVVGRVERRRGRLRDSGKIKVEKGLAYVSGRLTACRNWTKNTKLLNPGRIKVELYD